MNKIHRMALIQNMIATLLLSPLTEKKQLALDWYVYRESMIVTEPRRLILHEVS